MEKTTKSTLLTLQTQSSFSFTVRNSVCFSKENSEEHLEIIKTRCDSYVGIEITKAHTYGDPVPLNDSLLIIFYFEESPPKP